MAQLWMWLATLAFGAAGPETDEPVEAAESPERFAVQEWSTDDAHVVWVPDSRVPTARVVFAFPAGRDVDWFEANHGKEAIRWASRDTEGTLRIRASELAVDVRTSLGRRWSRVEVGFLAEDFEAVRGWLRDWLANVDYDRKHLVRIRKEARLSFEQALRSPTTQQFRAAWEGLFGDATDPRVRRFVDEPDVSIDAEELAATKARVVTLPGRVVGVAGDLDQAQVESLVDLLPPVASPPKDFEPTYGPPVLRPERPGRQTIALDDLSQVYLLVYRDSPTLNHPDQALLALANHVLGGHFYSRLYVALRHDTGLTYSASAVAQRWDVPMLHYASTYSRTESADEAEEILLRTLATFHADGITETERTEAVSFFQGRRAFARTTPEAVLAERMAEVMLGLPRDFRAQNLERMAKATLSEINEMITRRFDPADFTVVRVEPK